MANPVEVQVDISYGSLPTKIYSIVIRSQPGLTPDDTIANGNVEAIFVYKEDPPSVDAPDPSVNNTAHTSFSYVNSYDVTSGTKYGDFYAIEAYDAIPQLVGKLYFDASGVPGISSINDVTFRVLTQYPLNLYLNLYATPGNVDSGVLHLTLGANIVVPVVPTNVNVRLDQSFSILKRSYLTIQNEKTFKSNDDYLRKLKTKKTRKTE